MSKVLVVEDEPWLGQLYQNILAQAGHEVTWCRDGFEAIESVDVDRPDIIVLDLLLPFANGIQFLHELCSHGDLATIPVVVWSNAVPQQIESAILRAYGVCVAADKATSKPQQLLLIIQKVLGSARSS